MKKSKSKCAKVAPELWAAVSHKLSGKEKVALQRLILAGEEYHKHIWFRDTPDIECSFLWSHTKEGSRFWDNVYEFLKEAD